MITRSTNVYRNAIKKMKMYRKKYRVKTKHANKANVNLEETMAAAMRSTTTTFKHTKLAIDNFFMIFDMMSHMFESINVEWPSD